MIPQEEEDDDSLSIKEIKANSTKSVKGFNFWDERIIDGQWINQPNEELIQKFLRVLAICHTAIPDVNSDTGEITYEAESPDEAAFVIASRELGFEFFASVMIERLAKHGRQNEKETKEHIKRYAEAGLRTLVITYREVDEDKYRIWEEEFLNAKALVTEDRESLIDAAADK